MEIASQEDHDMPTPSNTTLGGGCGSHGHMIHHHHDHHAANSAPPTHNNNITTQPPQMPLHGNAHGNNCDDDHQDPHHVGDNVIIKKPVIKYQECLKNHAAAMGGNATDGCREFMPSGEDGSIKALTCSACNCHRNFHRKEVEGEPAATAISTYHHPPPPRKLMLNHHNIRSSMPHQMIMPVGVSKYRYNHNNSKSEEFMEEDGVTTASRSLGHPPYNQKKRFRTNFTPEQKEKMLNFAEKVGWKLQRQEDSVVQRFCEEIGVKRRVFKVWMHNNKIHFSKKNNNNSINLEDNENGKINNLNNVDLSGNNDISKIVP